MLLALCGGVTAQQAANAPLTTLDYRVTGVGLEVTPSALAVPKGIAGSVGTALRGEVPAGSYVEAWLRGPSFPARRLVGAPNAPIMLPPLNLTGDYQLDGIRLTDGTGATLLDGVPSSVPVRVFEEVLVSRVESRPLTMAEIEEKGIVIDENNFRAVEFEVGFVVDGVTIPVKFPVVAPAFRQTTEVIPAAELEARLAEAARINRELAVTVTFPPSLETAQPNIEIKGLNFQPVESSDAETNALTIPPIPALMVIPGNIGFLNQFFSVMIFTENGSPDGSGLRVRNLQAELLLPTGPDRVSGTWSSPGDDPLRFARVGEEAVISNILRVRQPGPDGLTGTNDDIDQLQPGDTGQAEFLVEGMQEGLHVMDLTLNATLDGLAAGPVDVVGRAAGSVLVRNPKFSMAFSHPRTVRTGEPYEAYVTILNTSQTPANLVSVTLNRNSVSGGVLESPETVELGTIAPGQTAVATFRVRAQRTGAITFSNLTTSDDSVVGRFRLRTGVDERGVPLSPDTLLLPDFVNSLPAAVVAAANRVLGQALSSATAGMVPAGVIPVNRETMRTKALELAEAGQRVAYGDSLHRVLADLLLDWHGGRATSNGWDQLLRETDAGLAWRETVLAAITASAPADAVTQLGSHAPAWAGRSENWWISAGSAPAVVLGLTDSSNKEASEGRSAVPFAAGYPGAEGDLLATKTPGLFRWSLAASPAAPVRAALLHVRDDGTAQLWTWLLGMPAGPLGASFDPAGGNNDLQIDDNGDGTPDRTVTATVTPFVESPPAVIAVRQDPGVKVGRPPASCIPITTTNDADESIWVENYANVLAVLFSKPMTQGTANVASVYQLDDGNQAYSVQIQPGGRVALVSMNRPVGALAPRGMTVAASVCDARGTPLVPAPVTVHSRLAEGTVVRGRVVRANGTMAAGVPVTLTYYDEISKELDGCEPWIRRASQAITNDDGEFQFDLVLAGISYSISATDTSGMSADAVQAVLDSTREDQLQRQQLERLANSPSVRDTLLGAFAVGSLPEAIAKAEGLDRALIRDRIDRGSPRMGTESVVALRFRGRGSVIGRVIAANGNVSVANAVVNLFPDPASRELGRGLVADSEGRFVFYGVPLGVFSLEATSPQGHTRTIAGEISEPGQVVTVEAVLSETAPVLTELQGRVTEPDGSAHAGAQVYIGKFNEVGEYGGVVALATSDSAGYWKATHVPVGSYDPMALSGDGRRSAVRRGITAVAGSVTTVNLELQGRATVVGRVESSTGVPVAGAVVGGGEALVTSDALGRFTLTGVPTGNSPVVAILPRDPADPDSFARRGSGVVEVLAGADNFVVVRMEAVGRIMGRVFDANGAPVAGSDVAIPAGNGFFWTETDGLGRYEFIGLGLGTYDLSSPAPAHEGVFNADAAIDTIKNGTEEEILAAVGEAFAAFTGVNNPLLNGEGDHFNPGDWGFIRDVHLTYDGQTTVADVRLLGKGTISGTTVNGQGVPIGARVRLTGIGPSLVGSPVTVIRGERNSDPALGTFEFPDQALVGDWGLQAASPFYPVIIDTNGRTTNLEPNATGIVMRFPAVRETNGRLVGQVLLPDGTPAGANLAVKISFGNDFVIRTDGSGRFDTQITLPMGSYSVEASDSVSGAKGMAVVEVVAGQVNSATVKLLERGAAELLVTQADGTPVAGVMVEMCGGSYPNERFNGTTGADGKVGFSGVFEGPYATTASTVTATARIAGRSSLLVPAGGTGRATIVLAATASVSGVFLTVEGQPVPFANVALGDLAFGTTGANGGFSFNDVPLGSYRLTAIDAVTGRSGSRQITLTVVNEEQTVQLLQTALGTVTGTVINGFGTGFVPGAEVRLIHSDGFVPPRTVTTAPDGRFLFPGTPAGSFRLDAEDPFTGHKGSSSATLPATAATFEVGVQMQPLANLHVTVLRPDGTNPETLATVEVGDQLFVGDTDAQGRVSFLGIPLGSYVLTAQSRELGFTRRVQVGRITLASMGGTENVTLVLRGAGQVRGVVVSGDGVTPIPGAAVALKILTESLPAAGGSIAKPVKPDTLQVIAGEDGTFTFQNVPQGQCRLEATHQALGASANLVVPADGAVVDQTLTLAASGAVTGRLVRTTGAVVPNTDVLLTFASTSGLPGRVSVRSDSEGRFTASLIPVGSFNLESAAPAIGGLISTRGTITANGAVTDMGDLVFDEDFPHVVEVVPADTSDGIDIHTTVELRFNEPLAPASIDPTGVFVRSTQGGAVVPATVELLAPAGEAAKRLIRISPTQPLHSNTTYQVVVVSGELLNFNGNVTNRGPRDLIGRALAAMFTATFTTRDQEPPRIVSFTPDDGEVQVDPTTPVRLTFSEPLQPGVAITLTGPGGPVVGTVSPGLNGLLLTFLPSAPLLPNATYAVTVDGVRDVAGNPLAGQPLSRSFSTLDTIGPVLTDVGIKHNTVPTAGTQVILEAVPATPESGMRVRMSIDFVVLGTSPAGLLEVPFRLPQQGQIVVRAIAIDRYGNEGPVFERSITVVENQVPVVAFERVNPPAGEVRSGSWFSVRVSATDDGGVTTLKAAVAGAASTPLQTSGGTSILLQAQVNAAAVPGQAIEILAEAIDNGGRSSGQQLLTIPVSDGTAPAVAIHNPADGATVDPVDGLQLVVDWADNSGAATIRADLSGAVADSQSWFVTAAPNSTVRKTIAFSLAGAPTAGEEFTATVRATDAAGHTSTRTTTYRLPDRRSPKLLALSPLDGSSAKSLWSDGFLLDFDEAMAPEPLNNLTVTQGGTIVPVTVFRENENRRVRVALGSVLKPGSACVLAVPAGLTDQAGNPWQDADGAVIPPAGRSLGFTTATLAVSPPASSRIVAGQTVTLQADYQEGIGATTWKFGFNNQTLTTMAAGSTTTSASVQLSADATEAVLVIHGACEGKPDYVYPPVLLDLRPRTADDDNDGIPNGDEADHGLDPFRDDAAEDKDNDGLDNAAEIAAGTDPSNPDSDGDTIQDGDDPHPLVPNRPPVTAVAGELVISQFGTSPRTLVLDGTDPDNDPLSAIITSLPARGKLYQTPDGTALGTIITTVPATLSNADRKVILVPDPGLAARYSLTYKLNDSFVDSNPATVHLDVTPDPSTDTDGDGMPDVYEAENELNALVNDASADPDGDGLENQQERTLGTHPRKADTDGDTLTDSAEVTAGTNPLRADTDGDLLADNLEAQFGGNPLLPDTDGDGLSDGFEAGFGRYTLVTGSFTLEQAITDASARGGHLLSITSAGEQAAVAAVLGSSIGSGSALIGLSDRIMEGQFVWLTGELSGYRNFRPGEPNNHNDEDAVEITGPGLTWNDLAATSPGNYILETGTYTRADDTDTDDDGIHDAADGIEGLPNQPPVANADGHAVVWNETTVIPVAGLLANDSDPESQPIELVSFTQPTSGSIIRQGGDLRYTAPAGFPVSDGFSYTIRDSHGRAATAAVTLNFPPNQRPLAGDPGRNAGNLLRFVGNADRVEVADNTALDFGTGDFTVETWINLTPGLLPANNEFGVINKNATFQGTPGWGIEVSTWGGNGTNNKFSAAFFVTNQSAWGNTNVSVGGLNAGTWHHLAGVRSGSTLRFYVNGSLVSTKTHTEAAADLSNNQPVVLGIHSWGPALPGRMEQVRMWNRALSADEILLLPLDPVSTATPGLAAAWNFDEAAGTSVLDAGPNNCNGVLGGGVAGRIPAREASDMPLGSVVKQLSEDQSLIFALPASDPDGQPLQLTVRSLPTRGRLYQVLDGADPQPGAEITALPAVVTDAAWRVAYVPAADFNGTDSFTYTAGDGMLDSQTATVWLVVNRAPDAPLAVNDGPLATAQSFALTTPGVLTNDSDPDGDPLGILDFSQAAHGTVVHEGGGVFTYSPDPDYSGSDSFTYRVTDGTTPSAPATVSITVKPAATVAWINPAGGNWHTAANWSPARVPGADDRAVIDLSGTYTVTISGSNAAPLNLTLGASGASATLRVSGVRFSPGQTSTVAAGSTLWLDGGDLGGNGSMTVAGSFLWSGGTLYQGGKLKFLPSATAVFSGGSGKYIDRIVENAGTITYNGSNLMFNREPNANGRIENLAGGVFIADGDGDIGHNYGGTNAINNAGTFIRRGAGTTTINQLPLHNTGTVRVEAGTLDLPVGASVSGLYQQAGGTVLFRDATFALQPGIDPASDQLRFVNCTLNVASPTTLSRLRLEGGGLYGVGDLTVTDSFEWVSGTLGTGGGKLILAATATMTATGGSGKFIDRILENSGTIAYTGSNLMFNRQENANGRIENLAGGVFIADGDGDIGHNYGGTNAINNAGTFVRRGAGTTTINTLPLHNTGTVRVEAGTLDLPVGASVSGLYQQAGGTVLFRDATFALQPGIDPASDQLRFVNCTLNVASATTVSRLRMEGGGLYGAGDLTVTDSFEWVSGTLGTGGGKLIVAATATMTATGSSGKFIDRIVENSGTIAYTGSNLLFNRVPNANGSIENLAGGVFIADGDGDIGHNYGGTNAINNAGTFIRRGAGTTTINSLPLHNTGTVRVEAGALDLPVGASVSGLYQQAGGTILFRDSTFALQPGIDPASSQLRFVNCTLNVASATSVSRLRMEDGGLYGAGDLTIADSFELPYGILGTGGGKLILAATATATFSGGSGKFIDRIVENSGTITYNGSNLQFNREPNRNGRIENLAGGVFIADGDGDIGHYYGGTNAINNAGVFSRRGAGTTTISGLPLTNTGIIDIEAGTLQPSSGFTQKGILAGRGTLAANCLNEGIIRPDVASPPLTVSGNLTNAAAGRVELTLGAADGAGNHVALHVTGLATGAGTLAISLESPFAEPVGDTFSIFTFGSGSGDFTAVEGLTGNQGYDFSRSFAANAMKLTVLTAGEVPALSPLFTRNLVVEEGCDSDSDGVSDQIEQAFGSNPADGNSVRRVLAEKVTLDGVSFPGLRWWQRTDHPLIRYELEYSRNLVEWFPADGQKGRSGMVEMTRKRIDDSCEEVLTRLATPFDVDPVFLRIKVELAEP